MDSYGLSTLRRTITNILDEFQIQYEKQFKPHITVIRYCKDTIEIHKKTQFFGEQIIRRVNITEGRNHTILDRFELMSHSILIGTHTHDKIAQTNNIQIKGKQIEPSTMKLLYAIRESNSINIYRCQDCQSCTSCSPFIVHNNEDKIMIKRNREQVIIEDCIRLEEDGNGNKIIVTKLPADIDDLSRILGKSNEMEVKKANDRKMKALTEKQRRHIIKEFLKMKEAGYIVSIDKLTV